MFNSHSQKEQMGGLDISYLRPSEKKGALALTSKLTYPAAGQSLPSSTASHTLSAIHIETHGNRRNYFYQTLPF